MTRKSTGYVQSIRMIFFLFRERAREARWKRKAGTKGEVESTDAEWCL